MLCFKIKISLNLYTYFRWFVHVEKQTLPSIGPPTLVQNECKHTQVYILDFETNINNTPSDLTYRPHFSIFQDKLLLDKT